MGNQPHGWYSKNSLDHLLSVQGLLSFEPTDQPRGLDTETENANRVRNRDPYMAEIDFRQLKSASCKTVPQDGCSRFSTPPVDKRTLFNSSKTFEKMSCGPKNRSQIGGIGKLDGSGFTFVAPVLFDISTPRGRSN